MIEEWGRDKMKATLVEDHIEVTHCFDVKEAIKTIPGRRWDPKKKVWILPATLEAIDHLKYIPGNVDISIKNKYEELKRLREKTTNIKLAEEVKPIEPMPIKVKPFQHQVKAYNLALLNPNFALLMEMGTGKSLTSVAIAARRYLRGEVKKLLIVAPTSVCPVWPKEFLAAKIMYKIAVLEGPIQRRIKELENLSQWTDFLQVAVINYEATWRMIDALLAWKPDMVIADESQRIKNPTAQQSKAMHKLGKIAKYKLILSGTPVQNTPLDFFSQYKFLDDSIFGTSYYAFRARYAIMGGYGGKQVIGYNRLDELIQKAHSIAFRVTKEEALDLPEQVDEFRYCELEPKAKRIYEEIKKDSYTELENGEITVRNVLTRLLRLQQITGGYVNTDDGIQKQVSKAKLETLKEIVEDIVETGKKVVIFARFIPEIHAILKMLQEMQIGYSFITGEVPINERGKKVKQFQEDPDCKVFIAQIQTAGLGITLHAADTAIFYSVDFSYANYEQARARIHRIGQRNNCTYIHLLAKNTVDEHVMKALQKKEDMAKMVVDNWRMYFE
ncbi:DEAD/DEAH box helicase [Caldanaerobius polysaccharolyticus]|uniref:DEAD/DEAH box helicase n=1 Tax=Caldanaerobius polysaccharolyticus TaxID=44256 RepID=UPI001C54CE47|nr:DEAD/DEAH box helicase [Caldanaerobius polysaccharolyticus]